MGYTKKEQMHETLNKMLDVIQKCISNDLANGKNINLCISAYNYWREEECDGQNYIFNIDDKDDLKYLVENEMITASGIAYIIRQKTHLFVFEGDVDAGVRLISPNELIEKLIVNATYYMAYAIMYVGRCGNDSPYANIYDEYVTTYIQDYFK